MVLRAILSELSYVGELAESMLNLLMRSIASGTFIGCKRPVLHVIGYCAVHRKRQAP